MAKLVSRSNKPEKEIPKKKVADVIVGDHIVVRGLDIIVVQIDKTKNGFCFVDKYAEDYNVTKSEKIELVESNDK